MNSDSNSKSNSNSSGNSNHIDRSDWLYRMMSRNAGISELMDRVFPLNRAVTFNGLYGVGQGTKVRRDVILRLIMQHLEYEGYTATRKLIEDETAIRYVDVGINESRLLSLLRRSIRATEIVWQLCLDKNPGPNDAFHTPDEIDDELVAHLSQRLGVLNESADGSLEQDVDVWQEGEDKPNINIMFGGDAGASTTEVKAASINKLVERLTPMGDSDLQFMSVFLLTYQSFMTPMNLFVKLVARYRVPKSISEQIGSELEQKIKMRVVNVMKNWMEDHFHQFDEKLIRSVRLFIDELTEDNNPHLAKLLHAALSKKEDPKKKNQDLMFNKPAPDAIVPKNIFAPDLDPLRHISEEELARQLTLIEYGMFRNVQASELLNLAWSKPKYRHRAKNVLSLIARFNTISSWVSSQLLLADKIRERVKLLTKFIAIAEHCRNLNNFSTLQAILSGLSNAGVHRLKYTFEDLSNQSKKVMEDLKFSMSSLNNHKQYRETLKSATPPKVPYLGVYLTDLTFIEDGNQDLVKTEANTVIVNFGKRRKIAQVIQEIQRNQQTPYNLLVIDQVFSRLIKLPPPLVEEEMYKLSMQLEPRGKTREEIQ